VFADVLLAIIRGWLTAIIGAGLGIVYLSDTQIGQTNSLVVVPAGVALLFTAQSLMQISDLVTDHPIRVPLLVLFEKLLIAYAFFGIGMSLRYFEFVP